MKCFLVLVLFLCSCTSITGSKVTIYLKNSQPFPIQVSASSGPFGKTLILLPGQSWSGWVPYMPGWGDVKVDIAKHTPEE